MKNEMKCTISAIMVLLGSVHSKYPLILLLVNSFLFINGYSIRLEGPESQPVHENVPNNLTKNQFYIFDGVQKLTDRIPHRRQLDYARSDLEDDINEGLENDALFDRRLMNDHTDHLHYYEECSHLDVKLVVDREIFILTSRPEPNPYGCSQHFEAANSTSVLQMTCHTFDLRFSCQYESFVIKANNEIHTLCSGVSPPVQYAGKEIQIDYERHLFGLHGGYTCSIVAVPFMLPVKSASTCGLSAVDEKDSLSLRVVNGVEAKKNAFPWMALLEVKSKLGKFFCGGTLLSDSVVVTAAHCLLGPITEISVSLGKLNLTDQKENGSIKMVSRKFFMHSKYDNLKLFNDIGVVILPQKVNYSEHIRPVCLPSVEVGGDIGGYSVTVLGWGATRHNGTKSSILQRADLKTWTNEDCSKVWTGYDVSIQESEICALGEGKDTCNGDSGGPLLVKLEKRWILLGVTSYGFECAKPGIPGVYSRVSKYRSWLEGFLKEKIADKEA